ncbi:hypothetical protein KC669_04065 [Candidatus Dojkabacteria bacterium]|uniref:Uncharacterized protein n=1 Tax=Candidatus Dojkabacteria bacterium TaxID=2099670 RepID=A0A955LBI8_9BACT|nr:hypothetical protein [Candidatus Dojkabacteria bacterium]
MEEEKESAESDELTFRTIEALTPVFQSNPDATIPELKQAIAEHNIKFRRFKQGLNAMLRYTQRENEDGTLSNIPLRTFIKGYDNKDDFYAIYKFGPDIGYYMLPIFEHFEIATPEFRDFVADGKLWKTNNE